MNNISTNNDGGTASSVPATSPETTPKSVSVPTTTTITIDDFAKVEMKMGKILSAEAVEGSEKLLKLSVDFGEALPRQVFSGIAKSVHPQDLVNCTVPFVTNLLPRKIMGMESQAMIVAVHDDTNFAVLKPSADIKPGTRLG
jgi:methionine--tRNA ligase beta chain